jgi:hypothetical protein
MQFLDERMALRAIPANWKVRTTKPTERKGAGHKLKGCRTEVMQAFQLVRMVRQDQAHFDRIVPRKPTPQTGPIQIVCRPVLEQPSFTAETESHGGAIMPKMTLVTGLLTLLLGVGCGGTADDVPPKIKREMSTAIGEYVKAHHFDMQISSYRSATVEGEKAAALYKMKGMEHDVTVTWRFTFKKDGDGGWKVTSHARQ